MKRKIKAIIERHIEDYYDGDFEWGFKSLTMVDDMAKEIIKLFKEEK